jgi:hypothetical protein
LVRLIALLLFEIITAKENDHDERRQTTSERNRSHQRPLPHQPCVAAKAFNVGCASTSSNSGPGSMVWRDREARDLEEGLCMCRTGTTGSQRCGGGSDRERATDIRVYGSLVQEDGSWLRC